jgi:hypothetical protein
LLQDGTENNSRPHDIYVIPFLGEILKLFFSAEGYKGMIQWKNKRWCPPCRNVIKKETNLFNNPF